MPHLKQTPLRGSWRNSVRYKGYFLNEFDPKQFECFSLVYANTRQFLSGAKVSLSGPRTWESGGSCSMEWSCKGTNFWWLVVPQVGWRPSRERTGVYHPALPPGASQSLASSDQSAHSHIPTRQAPPADARQQAGKMKTERSLVRERGEFQETPRGTKAALAWLLLSEWWACQAPGISDREFT